MRKALFYFVRFLAAYILFLIGVMDVAWGDSPCASFHLSGENFEVQESPQIECRSLNASFDLTACKESKPLSPAKILCSQSGGSVSIRTKTHQYRVVLKRYVGERGNSLWDVSGPVKDSSLPVSSQEKSAHLLDVTRSSAQVPLVAQDDQRSRGVERNPAAVVGTTESSQSEKAQQTANPEPSPSPSPSLPSPSTISFAGILDVYASHNFNRPPVITAPTSANPGLPAQQNQLHNFDLYNDQFGLNLAELTFKNTGKEVSFFADLDFGQMADYVSRSSTGPGGGTGATDDVSKHIGQAVLSYSPASVPGLSFTVGKMDTNMGYETTKAINNWQYSRSFLFSEGLPYWHLGASASYAFMPGVFTVTGYIYNGWNSLYSNNSGKTFALQATWNISPKVALTYNGVSGPEQSGDTTDLTQVHELIATWNATEKLQFAWDSIYGWAGRSDLGLESADWEASSLAFKYQALPWYSISPRIEFYRDIDGYTTGTSQNLTSLTLTQAVKHSEGLEPRLELRWDHSTTGTFTTNSGTSPNQVTVTLAVLYGF